MVLLVCSGGSTSSPHKEDGVALLLAAHGEYSAEAEECYTDRHEASAEFAARLGGQVHGEEQPVDGGLFEANRSQRRRLEVKATSAAFSDSQGA
ncbi:hypothetical protein Efla_007780 [Eimeria flavescens]